MADKDVVLTQYKECLANIREHKKFIWQIPAVATTVGAAFAVVAFVYVPADKLYITELLLFFGLVITFCLLIAVIKHSYFTRIWNETVIKIENELGLKHIQAYTIKKDEKHEDYWHTDKAKCLERCSSHEVLIGGMYLLTFLYAILLVVTPFWKIQINTKEIFEEVSIMSIVIAISEAVAALALVIGLIIACKQINEHKRIRNLQEFATLMEQWGQDEARGKRLKVITKFPDDTYNLTEEEDKLIAGSVGARFNRIGFMVKKKLIPKEYAIEIEGESALRCWRKLEGYVRKIHEEYEEQGIQSNYMKYFKWFAVDICKPHLEKKPQ